MSAPKKSANGGGMTIRLYTKILVTLFCGGLLLCIGAGYLGEILGFAQVHIYNILRLRKDYLIIVGGLIMLFSLLNVRKAFKAGISHNWQEYKRTVVSMMLATIGSVGILCWLFGIFPESLPTFILLYVGFLFVHDIFIGLTYKVQVDLPGQAGEVMREMGGFCKFLRVLVTLVSATLAVVIVIAMAFSGPNGEFGVSGYADFYEKLLIHWQYVVVIVILITAHVIHTLFFGVSKHFDVLWPHLPGTLVGSTFIRMVILYVLIYYFDMSLNALSQIALFVFGVLVGCVYIPSRLEFDITTAREAKG